MRMLGGVTVRWLALLALCAAYLQGGWKGHELRGRDRGVFEHLGLVGGFILVAWYDLKQRQPERV